MRRRTFLKNIPPLGLADLSIPSVAGPIPAAPPSDRTYRVQTLTRLAEPILDALANDRLSLRMPVEARAKVTGRPQYSHLEAFGRLLAGIGPWLALTTDDEIGLRTDYRLLVSRALANAVNRQARDFLNFSAVAQPLVDAAFLAQGLLRAPVIWEQASALTRTQLLDALRQTRQIKPGFDNWLLFSGMIEALFMAIGEPHDLMRLDYALRQHEQWYKGDGVFGDGPDFHWDYYNSFVIQPFLTNILRVVAAKVPAYTPMRQRILRIGERYAVVQERLIASDGSFPVLGRSMAYRAGAFHHLANAALLGEFPATLSPAQVRGALTAVLHRTLDVPGTFDTNGWLTIGLSGHQPGLGETYISTGSLYLTATALLPIGLPAKAPFWALPPAEWTSRQVWAGRDLSSDQALTRLNP